MKAQKSESPFPLTRPLMLGAAVLSVNLSGCAVSSDPTQGGLFWSERGSQERIYQREDALDDLRRSGAQTEAQNTRLESDIRRMR